MQRSAPSPHLPPGGWVAQRRAWLRERERGDTSLSAVILWPALLIIVWLALQAGLMYYGRNIALSAAEQGAQAARYQPVSTSRGETSAREFLGNTGALIQNPQVAATIDGNSVHVQVDAAAISLLPWVTFHIQQQSVQPIEQLAR